MNMGREIRRVPQNWEHPKDAMGYHIPLFDDTFEDDVKKWDDENALWLQGKHPDQEQYPDSTKGLSFAEWDRKRPEYEDYVHYTEERTWYQVYETVTEGTPATPAFATKAEIVEYLVEHGDYGNQRYNEGGWSRKAAEYLVNDGWVPSGIVDANGYHKTEDAAEILADQEVDNVN